MNIYIMTDMEGISGIVDPEQVMPCGSAYSEGRRYMTWDINACVEGCLKGGAEKVYVRDTHHKGRNIIWDELSPHAVYFIGDSGVYPMPGIDDCDGVILLGHHAMAGTAGAILEHTMSSSSWQNFWINGKLTGEIGMEAAIAGEHGKPVIMVSGDDKACAEAEGIIPDIVKAQVKEGITLIGGKLLSKEAAHILIYEKAAEAVCLCKDIKPYRLGSPVTLRLELLERGRIPLLAEKPHIKIIDNRTYEVVGKSVEEAVKLL